MLYVAHSDRSGHTNILKISLIHQDIQMEAFEYILDIHIQFLR